MRRHQVSMDLVEFAPASGRDQGRGWKWLEAVLRGACADQVSHVVASQVSERTLVVSFFLPPQSRLTWEKARKIVLNIVETEGISALVQDTETGSWSW